MWFILTLSILSIAFTGIIFALPQVFALEENGVIEMPFTENPPSIDGMWTSNNEWSDASQTQISSAGNNAYVFIKHDREFIYVMIDAITDQSDSVGKENVLWVDGYSVCFDTNNSADNSFDNDDFCVLRGPLINVNGELVAFAAEGGIIFSLKTDGTFKQFHQPSGAQFKSGFASKNDPYEPGRNHPIHELQIPLSFLHKQDMYGFFIKIVDSESESILIWPQSAPGIGSIADVPLYWGTLQSQQNTVTSPPVPFISVSTKSISFGNEEVSDRSVRSITITNTGTGILKVNNIRGTGEFSASGITTIEVQPSQSVTFDAVFAPLSLGEKSGSIIISSNDLSNPSYAISVEGKGVEKGANPLSGGGCLIATAAFGSELAPEVQRLREVRDNVLLQTESGIAFMTAFNQFYYTFSPTVADWERQNPIFKEAVKIAITPLLTTLSILNYVGIDSEEEMLGYGIGVILLNIGMYFVAPAFVIMKIRRISS